MFRHLLILAVCKSFASALYAPWIRLIKPDIAFDWSSIQPSRQLVYHDCYGFDENHEYIPTNSSRRQLSGSFRCARLLLPLDWQNISNQNHVTVAVIKLPAQQGIGSQERRTDVQSPLTEMQPNEAIFLNPGGPGGSGIQALLALGHQLQNMINGDRSYDFISFDPRGVGISTNANCFADYLSDQIWDIKDRTVGELGTSPEVLGMKLASAEGRAHLCAMQNYNKTEDNIGAYVTTASVARDMLEILKIQTAPTDSTQAPIWSEVQPVLKHQIDASYRLNYIGLSYGTFIGNTFASMYPQHTGKMLLDGNVDAENWVGKWFDTSIVDFEQLMSYFYEKCYSARQSCALWRASDTSPAAIEARVGRIITDVRTSPIPVQSPGSSDLITFSEVKMGILSASYRAEALVTLASFLNDIYEGNVSGHLPWLRQGVSCAASNTTAWSEEATHDAMVDVSCGDAESLDSTSRADFEHYLTDLKSLSPLAGPISSEWRLRCLKRPSSLRPKWRFAGPFGTTAENNTQTPILFLNNRLDPVCPIRNARKMAARYAGSVVLEQDGVGHCALGSMLGDCVRGHIKNYFNHGILPADNTVCPGACPPFEKDCEAPEKLRLFEFLDE